MQLCIFDLTKKKILEIIKQKFRSASYYAQVSSALHCLEQQPVAFSPTHYNAQRNVFSIFF